MWLTTNTKSLQVSKSSNCNARFTDTSTLQLSLELGALSLTHPKVSSRTHWDLKSTQTDGLGNDHTHSHCTWYISSFDHPMSLEELLSLKNKTTMNLKMKSPENMWYSLLDTTEYMSTSHSPRIWNWIHIPGLTSSSAPHEKLI